MALGAQVMKNMELVAFIRVHCLNLTRIQPFFRKVDRNGSCFM